MYIIDSLYGASRPTHAFDIFSLGVMWLNLLLGVAASKEAGLKPRRQQKGHASTLSPAILKHLKYKPKGCAAGDVASCAADALEVFGTKAASHVDKYRERACAGGSCLMPGISEDFDFDALAP